jgi:predicted dithiol-disulfide oxidoreductase (DUF899 family)
MSDKPTLVPAPQLAARNQAHVPGESPAYRAARNALLIEEIELRRHLERVAAQRRALPPGGTVPQDFSFASATGQVRLSQMLGEHDTLMVYSMMYGPQRAAPCPSCTSFLNAWDGIAVNLRERVAIAVTARSPIERLMEYRAQRGYSHLPLYADTSGDYTRAYVSGTDADIPGFSVFMRRDGSLQHFYSGEMSGEMSDPGQDPRGAPDLDPLWTMLDWAPEGRGVDWYPKLEYGCNS